MFQNVLPDLFQADIGIVLRGYHHRINPHRGIALVFDGHLGFSIGTQVGKFTGFAHLRQFFGQPVSQRDRQRHLFRRFVASETEHHTLIPGADLIVGIGGTILHFKRFVNHPMAISGDCISIDVIRPQVCPLKLQAALS